MSLNLWTLGYLFEMSKSLKPLNSRLTKKCRDDFPKYLNSFKLLNSWLTLLNIWIPETSELLVNSPKYLNPWNLWTLGLLSWISESLKPLNSLMIKTPRTYFRLERRYQPATWSQSKQLLLVDNSSSINGISGVHVVVAPILRSWEHFQEVERFQDFYAKIFS